MKRYILFCVTLLTVLDALWLCLTNQAMAADNGRLWEVQSIDTMKTSRDKARAELNNSSFDRDIEKELTFIKNTGANYVAVGTPYDEEFLPYLKRWVTLARKSGLKVWFRGNWSNWEGWFNYPKSLAPDDHLKKTRQFIMEHFDLFEDGDIFDSCPECENAGYWKQPERNDQYKEFIKAQTENNRKAFEDIGKKVYSNLPSVIGGRAKEVFDQGTFDALGNVVAIDHYIPNPLSMGEYVDYFSKNFHTKVLVSEFGAPIPDINGPMTEEEQAEFIQKVLEELYQRGDAVTGVNYYVLSMGTTALINPNTSLRKAYQVVTDYYSPGMVKGRVTDPLGDRISGVMVGTIDGFRMTRTDQNGEYKLPIPPRSITIEAGGSTYTRESKSITVEKSRDTIPQDFVIEPLQPDALYRIRQFSRTLRLLFYR